MWRATDGGRQGRSTLANRVAGSAEHGWGTGAETADLASYVPRARTALDPRSLLRRIVAPSGRPEGTQLPIGRAKALESSIPRLLTGTRVSARPAAKRWSTRWLLAGIAILLFGLSGFIVVALTVPQATIVITPAIEQRHLALTYGPPTAQGVDWVAPARTVQVAVEADVSVQATGEKQVPEGVARGRVRVVNATLEAFSLTVGQEFSGTNGVSYRVTENTYVPAADPFGSQSFGVADVPVEATVRGPQGNADVGVVAGQLANGILYRNVEPISGGTLRTVHFVTSDDLDRLRVAVERELSARIPSALATELRGNERVLDSTVRSGAPVIEYSHGVGAETDRVSAKGRLIVEAQAYDPEAMHRSAQEEAARRLAQSTTSDVVILGNTLQFGEPVRLDGDRWRVEVSAAVRFVPSEAELQRLRTALAGMSVESAIRRVRAVAGVADVVVELEPGWWPGRLPDRAARIEVVVRE